MSEIETITKLATESISMVYELDRIKTRREVFKSSIEARIRISKANGHTEAEQTLWGVSELFDGLFRDIK
tara:strand:+ start:7014 stop:7223 length:210 start_codon:yes stop_codon:yes gene_type:complete